MKAPVFVPANATRVYPVKSGSASYYFGEYHSSARGPQGFMNETAAGTQIRPHFHYENQFQVFFGGSPGAVFQRREITRLLVHYSEAGTAYGPISSGEEGMNFLTLRQNGNDSTGYMPEDKGLLDPARRRRHLQVDLEPWLKEPLPPAGETTSEEVLPPQDDSLSVIAVRVGSGAKFSGPDPEQAKGQYYIVVDGELDFDGHRLEPMSVGWCDPESTAPDLLAGDEGAHLLVLQFGETSDFRPADN